MARGFKSGGRTKGTPNRATVRREALEAEAAKALKGTPVRSDLDVMLQIRDFWMGMAAVEQREAQEGHRKPDKKLIHQALDMALQAAAKRAPFLHQKLSSMTVHEQPFDLSRLNDSELAQWERLAAKATVVGGDPDGDRPTAH